MLTEERRRLRGQLANRVAAAKAGDSAAAAAAAAAANLRREYRVVAAEDYIRELVESAPPLTTEQRSRLALLLRPTGDTAA